MATFYWNSGKKEDIVTQWIDHLQQEAYVKDINQIIKKNSQEISNAVKIGSSEQVLAIKNVCGKLEDVNFHLKSINSNMTELRGEINNMSSMLDWKLSQLIEEQRITNQLLGYIAQLLRIPDSQKQRVYHIEQGLKYLKNAFMENDINSSFFIDALEEFKKAESIERKDYITLNRIGQIFLYSKKYLNFENAEKYFVKSARESLAEANVKGTTVSNNLSPYGYNTAIYSNKPFIAATAESYLYAGRACYLQGKISNAIEYSRKAYELIPEFLLAGFELSKYLAVNDEVIESARLLNIIISKDRFYSIKIVLDDDLISKKEIRSLLEKIKVESYNLAKKELKEIKSDIHKDSKAIGILSKIENYLFKNNYLSNMKALDLLNATYNFEYIDYYVDFLTITKINVSPKLRIKEFIQKENNSQQRFKELLKDAIELKKQSNKKEFFLGFGNLITPITGGLGVMVGLFTHFLASIIIGTLIGLISEVLIYLLFGIKYKIVIKDHTK